MEVAIRYEKIDLGDDRFVFKPIGIVYGRYDEINGVFVTEYDEKCYPITGNRQYENSYFGDLIYLQELFNVYNDLSEEEVLKEYFNECNSYYNIGFFDYVENRIQILKLPSNMVTKYFVKDLEHYDEPKSQVSNYEVTFDLSEIKELREIDDINKIHVILDDVIERADLLDKKSNKNSKEVLKSKLATSLSIKKEESKEMTLLELRKEVKDVIKGQDKAVDDVTRTMIINQKSSNSKHKSHILMTGPTGTGKTKLVSIVAEKMGIPYFEVDSTAYTKEGWVGKSVYSMFNRLIEAANGDIEKAQNGILIMDEIDKKLSPKKDDPAGIEVLNSLLKIMDGSKIEIEVGSGPDKQEILFDTSNVTMIFMGAFEELYKEKEMNSKKFLGFELSGETEKKSKKTIITSEDLIKAGMPPEFLGRIPVVTNTDELDFEDLVEILYKSKGGAIDQEKEFCKELGVNLTFSSQYISEIAKKAVKSKTGARDLNKIVKESLADAYDKILSGQKVKVLRLTKQTVNDNKKYYTE